MGFGDYPADYNPRVHGPYDPARYYGKGKWFIIFNSGIFQIDDLFMSYIICWLPYLSSIIP